MLRHYKGGVAADAWAIGAQLCSLGRAKAQPLQHLKWVSALDMAGFSEWEFW
jgi:hypothetical protein